MTSSRPRASGFVLLGMPADAGRARWRASRASTTFTVRSPLAGVIETLDVREGMTVSSRRDACENQRARDRLAGSGRTRGTGCTRPAREDVEARLTAYPGQSFHRAGDRGTAQANTETRTVRVRIELDNPDGRLRPGMFAQVRLGSGRRDTGAVCASEAIISTGTRTIVIVAGEQGRFAPTEVQIGADVDGKTVILEGLTGGTARRRLGAIPDRLRGESQRRPRTVHRQQHGRHLE